MLLVLITGLFLLFAAVVLLTRGVAMPRTRASATISQISAYGYTRRGAAPEEEVGFLRVALDEIAGRLGALAAPKTGHERERKLRASLMAAAVYSVSVRKLTGYRIAAAFSFGVAWLWLMSGVLALVL